ncbi:MAG: YHYH protein, partial [Bacteroidota bacterium]
FREDYAFIASDQPDYLDEHNGRFCVTPEYPDGTYAYFATVNEDWTSAYPYAVGPTFAGLADNRSVDAVNEATTVFDGTTSVGDRFADGTNVSIFPNPAADLIAVQLLGLAERDYAVELRDASGRLLRDRTILRGQTIAYFDTQTLYRGVYFVWVVGGNTELTRKVVVE